MGDDRPVEGAAAMATLLNSLERLVRAYEVTCQQRFSFAGQARRAEVLRADDLGQAK
jgi:hypothetical protein